MPILQATIATVKDWERGLGRRGGGRERGRRRGGRERGRRGKEEWRERGWEGEERGREEGLSYHTSLHTGV